MADENEDLQDVQETPEAEVAEETTDDETSENEISTEEFADLKKKAGSSEQNFERAKKAEKELKELKKSGDKTEAPVVEGLSPKDYLALTEKQVSSEDFDEVVRVANILGMPINEALKDKTLVSILNERKEERKTADATHTTGGARAVSKDNSEAILQKAEDTGEVPTTAEGMRKLAEARLARLRK